MIRPGKSRHFLQNEQRQLQQQQTNKRGRLQVSHTRARHVIITGANQINIINDTAATTTPTTISLSLMMTRGY